jgi:hypothetical protein
VHIMSWMSPRDADEGKDAEVDDAPKREHVGHLTLDGQPVADEKSWRRSGGEE